MCNFFFLLWYDCTTLLLKLCRLQFFREYISHSGVILMWMCNFIFFYDTIMILYKTVHLTIFQTVSHIKCEWYFIFSFMVPLWYLYTKLCYWIFQLLNVSHIKIWMCIFIVFFYNTIMILYYKLCYTHSFRW